MQNLSLSNKYRPKVYEDVIGQEAVVEAVRGKLKDGRFPRTSLFCGAHGTGKTTLARMVGKAVNCQNPAENGNPCCQCESCRNIDAGISSDVIELDAASHNKVEDAESIVKQAGFLPIGKKKIIILDEFHMMTKEAQNKLLKMVEEPPAHVMFIFCTTEEQKILSTILSRCNKFTFRGISDKDILENLKKICEKEQIEYEEDALKLIVKSADGHVRDSLSVLEQLSYEKLTAERVSKTLGLTTNEQIFHLLQAVVMQDMKETLSCVEEAISNGNLPSFLKSVVSVLCYICTFSKDVADTETAEFRENCEALKEHLPASLCIQYINIITGTLRDNRGLGLDLATRLCFLSILAEGEKEDKIAKLEAEVSTLRQQLSTFGTGTTPISVPQAVSGTVPIPEEETETIGVSMPDEWVPMDSYAINSEADMEVPSSGDVVINEIPFPEEEYLEPVVMPDTNSPMPVPAAPVATPQEMMPPVSGGGAASFTIPGGNVHPKAEVKVEDTKPVAEERKEVPAMDGQFISDFDGFGSFGGGLFGSKNARLF